MLDLGCRDGALTSTYLPGNRVVGVDVDRVALDRARRLGIETVWADLDQPLPFEDASFDVVVIADVLEHVRFPEHLLAEANRVLAPGGSLFGSVPNCYRLKSRLRFLLGRPPESDPTPLRMFSPADLTEALVTFDRVEIKLISGRFVRVSRRLFANDIAFRARTAKAVAPTPAPRPPGRSWLTCGTSARSKERPSHRPNVPARRYALLRTTRQQPLASTLVLITCLLLIFAALPEALGDWPYNVFGH